MRTRFRYDIRKDDLAALVAANYCVTEIANFYGCDRSTIYYWTNKLGIVMTPPRCNIDRERLRKMIADGPQGRASRRAAE
jgi:hypothetical protein